MLQPSPDRTIRGFFSLTIAAIAVLALAYVSVHGG